MTSRHRVVIPLCGSPTCYPLPGFYAGGRYGGGQVGESRRSIPNRNLEDMPRRNFSRAEVARRNASPVSCFLDFNNIKFDFRSVELYKTKHKLNLIK